MAFSATALPLLDDTFKEAESVEQMKKDKLSDQTKIIDLQNKLIKAEDEQVKKLQETVQSEVKSVQSDAVKRDVETEERGKNVVIYGAPEGSTQTLETRVGNIMEHVDQKPRIGDCCRLGKETEGSVRPMEVTLSSSYVVVEVLRKLLKNAKGVRQIFICPDRSVEQRKAQKGLVDQL